MIKKDEYIPSIWWSYDIILLKEKLFNKLEKSQIIFDIKNNNFNIIWENNMLIFDK